MISATVAACLDAVSANAVDSLNVCFLSEYRLYSLQKLAEIDTSEVTAKPISQPLTPSIGGAAVCAKCANIFTSL